MSLIQAPITELQIAKLEMEIAVLKLVRTATEGAYLFKASWFNKFFDHFEIEVTCVQVTTQIERDAKVVGCISFDYDLSKRSREDMDEIAEDLWSEFESDEISFNSDNLTITLVEKFLDLG